MKNKAIVHLMSKSRMNTWAFKADIDAIESLWEKYNVNNIIFYKWDKIDYLHIISKLEKYWIYTQNYSNKQDLIEKIKKFNEKYEIISIYTSMELLINTSNSIRKELWLVVSDYPNIFRNKFLQRKLLQENSKWLWIKYLKWEPENLSIEEIEKEIWYPFILKPVNWVQSSWVIKVQKKSDFENYINNYNDFHDRLKARWVDNKELIAEEFIDWELYTLDYFVTSEGKVVFSKPAQEILWTDFWVNDYFVVARIASFEVEEKLKNSWLNEFILETVKATKIKNTFVHHEFKLTTKWKLKTIELNWRLWGGRMDLYKEAYNINMFEMMLNDDLKVWSLTKNNIVFNICSIKRWKLVWIDEKLFDLISNRETVVSISFDKKFIWKETWLAKDWFTKMWSIKLVSDDFEKIMKDFEYIKTRYKKLLIVKTKEELIEERNKNKKSVFEKIKDLIS